MKKSSLTVVLLALAAYLCTAYVQAQVGGFRGLPWGASKEDVKKAEGNKTIDQSTVSSGTGPLSLLLRNQGLDSLVYEGKESDLDCVIAFYFAGDKLVQGRCLFTEKHPDTNRYIDDFKAVNASLIGKYGKPEQDTLMWRDERYKDDRTQWGKAVAEGQLAYHALWRLPDTVIMHQLMGVNHGPMHALQCESAIKEHLDLAREAREKAKSKVR